MRALIVAGMIACGALAGMAGFALGRRSRQDFPEAPPRGEGAAVSGDSAVAPERPGRRAMSAELLDVLAMLARKRANAERVRRTTPELEDQVAWTIRQIDVIDGDLRAGLHHGEVDVAAELAASAPAERGPDA